MAELVTVWVFSANLDASTRPRFVVIAIIIAVI
jgi:hypothetical protein